MWLTLLAENMELRLFQAGGEEYWADEGYLVGSSKSEQQQKKKWLKTDREKRKELKFRNWDWLNEQSVLWDYFSP